MDLAALKAEVAAYEAEHGPTDDQSIADALNARTVAVRRVVPIVDITTYLRSEGAWLGIVAAASTNPAAAAAVDYNGDLRAVNIDLDLTIVGTMLAGLVQSGLLTQAQADALMAMGGATLAYPATIGASTLTADDIWNARAS